MTRPDVFYIHGYEGSSRGTKGAWLQERYSCFGIDMPDAKTTHPLGREAPIGEVLAEIKAAVAPSAAFMRAHIEAQQPRVVVASSFGTAVWLTLVQSEGYRIPSVLLAPAVALLDVGMGFPADMRTIIIHGEHDALIPIESARRIHAASGPLSELWPIDDGHGLARLTTDRPELSRAIETLLAK